MINYALLKEEEFKKMALLNAFILEFGRELVLNQSVHFSPTIEDLEKMFLIVDREVFSNSLKDIPKFQFKTIGKNVKGECGYQIKNSKTDIISVDDLKDPSKLVFVIGIKLDSQDSFLNIASVLCHELIHYYDIKFGPMKDFANIERTTVDGKQMAGNYEVHGKFFKRYADKIYDLGIYVEEKYKKEGARYLMIDDNGVYINPEGVVYEAAKTNNGIEVIDENDPDIVKHAKRLFNSLKSDGYVGVSVKDDVISLVIE